MARAGVQLGVSHPFDDDLIEADRRNEQARDRRATGSNDGVFTKVDESGPLNGALRLGALPSGARIASRERAPGVRGAGVQEQRAAEHAKQRADAAAHGA